MQRPMDLLHALTGLVCLIALSWAASENRAAVRWRVVASGLALMVGLAALLLLVPPLRSAVFSHNSGGSVLQTLFALRSLSVATQ